MTDLKAGARVRIVRCIFPDQHVVYKGVVGTVENIDGCLVRVKAPNGVVIACAEVEEVPDGE